MSRLTASNLTPIAGLIAAVILSACSDVTDPAPNNFAAPAKVSASFLAPILAVTPDTLDFGAMQVGAKTGTKTVIITNVGTAPLNLWSAYAEGLGDFLPVSDTSSKACKIQEPIPPAAQCTFTWEFLPLSVGLRTGRQQLLSDGGNVDVQFRGTGYSTADVAVSMNANVTSAQVGKPVTYTITLKNVSGYPATGVTMTDALPAGTTFAKVSNSINAPCSAPAGGGTGNVSCTFGRIDQGISYTVQLVLNVVAGGRADLTNTASIVSTSTDPVSSNNSATVSMPVRGKK